jgi:hypothetical protein
MAGLTHQVWMQFREFIMLFLAVFCGFLAENYREDRQEEEMARGYLKSMVMDLQRDSTQLEQMLRLTRKTFQATDSLRSELLSNRIETNSIPAYKLLFKTFGFDDFAPNDGTMKQLKHSGSLRFIEEKRIVDGIMAYQESHTPLKIHEATMNQELTEVVKLRQNFDLIGLNKTNFTAPIPLLNSDRESINRFFERVEIWLLYLGRLEDLQENVLKKGKEVKEAILKNHPSILIED